MAEPLTLNVAQLSIAGVKPVNEDSTGVEVPVEPYVLLNKGITLAVADGVSTAEAGREASQTAIDRFIEEYYQTPDTWSVSHAGQKILSTINTRLFRKSHQFTTENKGFLCTFSALIVKSKVGHFFHVGDSRIYHFRAGKLKQLTTDHTAVMSEGHASLSRALGMDSRLNVDYGKVILANNDLLLLTSDGIHDFIRAEDIETLLANEAPVDIIAATLQDRVLSQHSNDNISVILARVVSLPDENLDDYSAQLTRLPFPPDLSSGMKIDGYEIEQELFASSRSQIYLVRDIESNYRYVMKTPSRNFEDDVHYIDRFIQEEWIGSRIHNEHVVNVIRQHRPRHYLYYLMEHIEGQGLDQWIAEHQPPSPKQAITIVKQIAEGLRAFHENEAVHQDLKPANIMLEKNTHRVVIVDFGSVYVAGLAELYRPLTHEGALGTASYSDPAYLLGHNPGIQGDVYSLATIVYEMFCGHLPYGERIEECRSAMDYDRLRYQSAIEHNPVIPIWFDRALQRGTVFDLEQRYRSIAQLLQDLTQPNPNFLRDEPVIQKQTDSVLFWKMVAGFLLVTQLLVIYLFTRQ